jgi:hypothetical protein
LVSNKTTKTIKVVTVKLCNRADTKTVNNKKKDRSKKQFLEAVKTKEILNNPKNNIPVGEYQDKHGIKEWLLKKKEIKHKIFNGKHGYKPFEKGRDEKSISAETLQSFIKDKKVFYDWVNKIKSRKRFEKYYLQPEEKKTRKNYYQALEYKDTEEKKESQSSTYTVEDTTTKEEKLTQAEKTNYTSYSKVKKPKSQSETMPRTIATEPPPPLADIANKMKHQKETTSEVQKKITSNTQEDDFQLVSNKQATKEKSIAFDEMSQIYLPKSLPPDCNFDEKIVDTTYELPVTVKITAHNSVNIFKNSRIVVGILRALQMVDKNTYLNPIDKNSKTPKLYRSSDLIPGNEDVLQYAEEPKKGKFDSYTMRIYISSNRDLNYYKQNQGFREYITTEKMVIDYNDLESTNPINAGFLVNVIARPETMSIYKARINQLLPDRSPRFNLSVQALHGPNQKTCRVFMIKCDKKNVVEIVKVLNKIVHPCINFFSFQSFLNMTPGKKLTVVLDQYNWSTNYRSLLLNGFKDNEDNIPMYVEEDDDMDLTEEEEELKNTSVSNYLRYHVRASNGEPLSEYVYPPCNGTREFLVTVANFYDGLNYMEVGRGELCRMMNDNATQAVFINPDEAITMSIEEDVWTTYERAEKILETNFEINHKESKNPYKRSKTSIVEERIVVLNEATKQTQDRAYKNTRSYANAVHKTSEPREERITSTTTTNKEIKNSNRMPKTYEPDILNEQKIKMNAMQQNISLLQQKLDKKLNELEEKTINMIEEKISFAVQEISTDLEQKLENNNTVLRGDILYQMGDLVKKEANGTTNTLIDTFKTLFAEHTVQIDTKIEVISKQKSPPLNNITNTNNNGQTITSLITNTYQKLSARLGTTTQCSILDNNENFEEESMIFENSTDREDYTCQNQLVEQNNGN